MSQRIIGIDPGTEHLAYAVLTGCESSNFLDLFCEKQETRSFDYYAARYDEMMMFVSEFLDICTSIVLTTEDLIYIERFQFRGFKTGPKIELVNLIIASIVMTVPCRSELITPALWKNFFNKHEDYRLVTGITEHEQDALNIALFGWYLQHNKKVCWVK